MAGDNRNDAIEYDKEGMTSLAKDRANGKGRSCKNWPSWKPSTLGTAGADIHKGKIQRASSGYAGFESIRLKVRIHHQRTVSKQIYNEPNHLNQLKREFT